MLLRFGFLYSCFMIVAGSSLLAELPSEPMPTIAASPAAAPQEATPTPAPAEPTRTHTAPYSVTAAGQTAPREPATFAVLQKKQQELKQIQAEVSQLRTELGVASQYQAEVLLADVSLKQLRELDPEIQGDGESLSVVGLLSNLKQHRTMPTSQFRALEHCLKLTGCMKTLAKPSLLLTEHQPTAFISGGEVPLPASGAAVQRVTYRSIGTSCFMTVKPLESGTLNVDFRIEHAVPDQRHVARLEGMKIPGMTCRSLGSSWEIQPGQTILMGGETRNDQDEPICMLAALTVTPIDVPEVITAPPALQPIPEPAPTK